jgi:hypothetical protein
MPVGLPSSCYLLASVRDIAGRSEAEWMAINMRTGMVEQCI